ncbi:uncharacterized protein LTR77_009504 [Saxophila tyrrhenica]|uniref:G-patch domain-containing protein n=1 Tax=Saxophila tyrrhenica TaxID=1690608 RepID=A0AAV9NYL4_9PEZI|nr:hypothetical protein LTR77_009504 [Saxophila tyrrhenica]
MSSQKKRPFSSTLDSNPSHAPYALIGTPLPAYDPEARDDGSYVPIWKQEVTDERGRKRLHGAFTGGWSAGYFNSVGSKEGWTPSTFMSSRGKKGGDDDAGKEKPKGQRVEDFMDEEDLAERAEGEVISTQDGFAGLGGGRRAGAEGGMFTDLFRATGETMGVKLLQRMGWRAGQGIGPKVRRKAKGDEKGEVHLFAPEDSRMIGLGKKKDRKGLGFAGEEKLGSGEAEAKEEEEDSERDAKMMPSGRSKVLVKPKQKLKKSGFGMGVLNDTGSDDEDAYDMGPKISYNRIIGGDKKKKGLLATNANPAVQQKPTFGASKKLTKQTNSLAGFRKCHDGRLPLDGFVLTTAPLTLLQENKYPPPTVPEGWQPSRLSQTTSNTVTSRPNTSTDLQTLDPKSRAAILGEQPLPGKSIFSFLTPSARDRLATATNRKDLPPALSEKAPPGFELSEADRQKSLSDLVPELDKATAAAALQRLDGDSRGGWAPYSEDAAKRDRYRYFLSLRAGTETILPPRPESMALDDWSRELTEFKRAAEVFGPISSAMSGRFTSSGVAGSSPSTGQGVGGGREEDPAEKAAKLGMFGPMTRSTIDFYPTRLLCKRFNVRPPAHVSGETDASGAGNGAGGSSAGKSSMPGLDRMIRDGGFKASSFVSGGMEGGEKERGEALVTSEGLRESRARRGEVDVERNEALEGMRAGEAVFRAVFGGDEDEEEDQ